MKLTGMILSMILITSMQLTARSGDFKMDTFKVYGNCGMCKSTIEKAATSLSGVKSATWDRETDMLTVTYNESKVKLDEIKQAVASSGYDSDTHRAPDEVYNKLHGCCQYERPKS